MVSMRWNILNGFIAETHFIWLLQSKQMRAKIALLITVRMGMIQCTSIAHLKWQPGSFCFSVYSRDVAIGDNT